MEFKPIELPEAASTNLVAASGDFLSGSLIYTLKQTHGRGCQGNSWESEPGRNISMTLVIAPEALPAARQFTLSMAAALGCYDFLSGYVDGVSVKWPNDIYVEDRKIAGILIENSVTGSFVSRSLIGVGMNINQSEFVSDAPNPVSLIQLTGKEYPIRPCIEKLARSIGKRMDYLHDFEHMKHDFMINLYRKTGCYEWDTGTEKFHAEISDIDDYGRLVLKDTAGNRRIYGFKEIRYVGAPNSFVK